MDRNNKLWKRMMIGAAIGAAISLFDKETRNALAENGKSAKKKIERFLKQPADLIESVTAKVHQSRQSFEQLCDDVSFLAGKIKEIKEKTPRVFEFVKEIKEDCLRRGDHHSAR